MPAPVSRPRDYRHRRPLVLLLLAIAFSALLVVAIGWWDTRELREAAGLIDQGEPRAALKIVDQFLREHPRDGQATMLRARVLVALGDWSGAIELYEQVGAATTDDLHALATALLHLEQWGAALPVLEMVNQQVPNEPDVVHELAACQAKLGLLREALENAERFSKLPDCETRGLLLIGTMHRELGNQQGAIDAWTRLISLDPDAASLQIPAAEFLDEFGRVVNKSGDPERAFELLQRSIEVAEKSHPDPDERQKRQLAGTLAVLGDVCLQLGRQKDAESHWRRAVEYCPDRAEPREALARLESGRGDGESALEWLAPLLTTEVELASVAYAASRAFAMTGDVDRSARWRARFERLDQAERLRSTLDQVLITSPDSFWASVIRAWRFADAGNWSEAERIVVPLLEARRRVTDRSAGDDPIDSADATNFVEELHHAIKTRGSLPPLDRLPVRDF